MYGVFKDDIAAKFGGDLLKAGDGYSKCPLWAGEDRGPNWEDQFTDFGIMKRPIYGNVAAGLRVIGEVITLGLGAIARQTAGNGYHEVVVLRKDNFYLGIHKLNDGMYFVQGSFEDIKSFANQGNDGVYWEKDLQRLPKPITALELLDIVSDCQHAKNTYGWDSSNCQHFARELHQELKKLASRPKMTADSLYAQYQNKLAEQREEELRKAQEKADQEREEKEKAA